MTPDDPALLLHHLKDWAAFAAALLTIRKHLLKFPPIMLKLTVGFNQPQRRKPQRSPKRR